MRNIFAALQLFAAFFLTLFGLGMLFRGSELLGALFAALGMTFLFLVAINIKK